MISAAEAKKLGLKVVAPPPKKEEKKEGDKKITKLKTVA